MESPRSFRPPSTWRSNGRTRCATGRTRTSEAPATARWDVRAGGTGWSSTAAWRCRTSTCATPRPPGCWSHDLGDRPAAVIIKHANPCGAGVADDLATAYKLAFEGDETSAFGGIVALNRPIDEATVAVIEKAAQADVVIAPGYDPGIPRPAEGPAQEHPAARGPVARRRGPAPAVLCRRLPRAGVAPLRGRPVVVAGRHQGGANRGPVAGRRDGVAAVRARHVQRGGAGERRPGGGHRRRPAEPGRRGRGGSSEGGGPGQGRGQRHRRLLPVPRRGRGGGGGRCGRRRAARREHPRRTRRWPPPTPTGSPWCSPASASSGTDCSCQR